MKFEWESFTSQEYENGKMIYAEITQRLKVKGGWLIKTLYHNNIGNALSNMVFIPDPSHEWSLNEEPDIKNMPIEELYLTVRTTRTLKNENIKTVCELIQNREGDLLRFPNLGTKSLREIKESLAKLGLSLGTVLK